MPLLIWRTDLARLCPQRRQRPRPGQAAKSTQALRENYVHRLTRGLIFATLMFLLLVAAALGVMRRAFKPVDRAGDMILRRQPRIRHWCRWRACRPSCGRSSIRSTSCSNASARRSSASVILANAAHELRTPLAALSAQAELVARSPDTPQRAEAVDKLRTVATHRPPDRTAAGPGPHRYPVRQRAGNAAPGPAGEHDRARLRGRRPAQATAHRPGHAALRRHGQPGCAGRAAAQSAGQRAALHPRAAR